MYALIYWEESKETSVLSINDIKIGKKTGKAKAKWGKTWYSARILRQSHDKSWLESLAVTIDGSIITREQRLSISPDLLSKKRQRRQENKKQKDLKKAIASQEIDFIFKKKPIFEMNLTSEESDNDLSIETKSESNEDTEDEYSQIENENSDKENDVPKLNDNEVAKKTETPGTSKQEHETRTEISDTNKLVVEDQKSCSCIQLPSVTREDIIRLNKILNLSREIYNIQNNLNATKDETVNKSIEFKVTKKPLERIDNDDGEIETEKQTPAVTLKPLTKHDNQTIELVEGLGVHVNQWKIKNLLELHRKKPRELVRRLMKLILGEEVLKNSSPTGKNGWKPIPENVYESVEIFVNENATKKKYKISHAEYREVLTALCATLRNPRVKKIEDLTLKRKVDGDEDDSGKKKLK